jgi:hypothetical protein
MARSRRVVALTIVALAILGVGATVTEVGMRPEVVPFASWSLFSRKPSPYQTDIGIRLVEVDGVRLDPAPYFEDSRRRGASSVAARDHAQGIGELVDEGEPLPVAVAVETWAGRYLPGSVATVEVVRRRAHLVERHRCDCFEDEQVLGTFEVGG